MRRRRIVKRELEDEDYRYLISIGLSVTGPGPVLARQNQGFLPS